MKKAIAVLLVALGVLAHAQPVQVTVTLRTPAPGALPVWASDPSIVQVVLRNTTPTLYDGAIVSFVIRRQPSGTIVAHSKDFHPLQPRFTIPPNGTLVLTGPQIIHESAVAFDDETVRQQAQASGQLPEGEYEFCARVLDAQGNQIGSTGAICPRTVVMLPDPPMLIHPRNDSTLAAGTMPMFIWAPVMGSAVPVTYTLRVVPQFPGQAPQDALNVNAAVLNVSGLVAPLYQYVPTDVPFTAFPQAIGFIWQVSALDAAGRPATRNNGKSEIFRFRFAPAAIGGETATSDTTTASGSTDTKTLGEAPSLPSGGEGSTIRRIELPHGFSIVLGREIACTSASCTISGSGALYVPLLGDSVRVTFDGITVRRPNSNGTAVLQSGTIAVPVGANVPMGLLTLAVRRLTATPTSVTLDGAWVAQWSQWDWSCRILDSVPIVRAPFYAWGMPRQTLPLPMPWMCSGEGLLVGPCIELRFDTLDVRVDVDTANRPPTIAPQLLAIGEATLPCIVAGGAPVRAGVRLRLDRGRADLVAILSVRVRDARLQGMPHLRLDADTLVVDLSSQANPRRFPPESLCANPAWSDPRWRGIYAPSLQARLFVGSDTVAVTGAAIFDQGVGNRLDVSIAAGSTTPDTLTVGGFGVRADSITVRLCRSTIQSISARGVVLMPPALQRAGSWGALDSIGAQLAAYDDGTRWRWNSTLTVPARGVEINAGQFVALALENPTIETIEPPSGQRRGYIEFGSVAIHIPASNSHGVANVSGLRIWNTGEIELSEVEAAPVLGASSGGFMVAGDTAASIRTALRWVSPQSFPVAVVADSVLLRFELENTGTRSIPRGMPFDLGIGAYVELPDGTRQYLVEQQRYALAASLPSRTTAAIGHTIWLPSRCRILGVRITMLPRPPVTDDDGEGNNTLQQGQVPPIGEVGR
ncbi:MAG: hypothetical protein N3B17_04885 [Chlorobi bacterium]|nr:hypothetical protein [Chlorobiota bacterium]